MKPVAIFDIDGTIFRKNLQFELLEGLSYEGIFPREARNKIVEYYRAWLENRSSYEKYRQLLVRLYRKHIKNCSQIDVLHVAKKVAAFHHGRLFIYTSGLFQKLKKTHYTVAISGSPMEIVNEFNSYLEFDKVYGTIFQLSGEDLYTGREEFTPVRHKDEVLRKFIQENGFDLKRSYGIGDTESDISFLDMVENPVAFNPDKPLKRKAEKEGWKIIVERKDVVYEINS